MNQVFFHAGDEIQGWSAITEHSRWCSNEYISDNFMFNLRHGVLHGYKSCYWVKVLFQWVFYSPTTDEQNTSIDGTNTD